MAASTTLGRIRVFPKEEEEEDELQEYLVEMEPCSMGSQKGMTAVLCIKLQFLTNIIHPFKDETTGKDWFYAFMKRT